MQDKLLVQYGGLHSPGYDAARVANNPVIQHFFSSPDFHALDFVELAFTTKRHCGGQRTVDAINDIFRDSAMGYELSPLIEAVVEPSKSGVKLFGRSVRTVDVQFPKIIRKDSQYIHAEATQPAITLLTDPRYKGANEEFLKAQEYFRRGDNVACLNECLKSFESTMKIICHNKTWQYNQSDTASKLVRTCLDNNLLPTFSEQQLTSVRTLLESAVPTTRNKKSGHGQGVQQVTVPDSLAKFALHSTASAIVLLVEASNE
jgi:hypothetical protein